MIRRRAQAGSTLFLSSEDGTYDQKSGVFECTLNNQDFFQNVTQVKLGGVTFPMTSFDVHSEWGNNVLRFKMSDVAAETEVTLTNMNFVLSSNKLEKLASEIHTQLNTARTNDGKNTSASTLVIEYVEEYDHLTFTFTPSVDGETYSLNTATTNGERLLYYQLGFPTTSPSYPIAAVGNVITTSNAVVLRPHSDLQIVLHSNLASGSSSHALHNGASILAQIPVTTTGTMLTMSKEWFSEANCDIGNIGNLKVSFRYLNGDVPQLRNAKFSLSLRIYFNPVR